MGRSEADKDTAEPFQLSDSVSHLLHRVEQLADERFAELAGESITLRQFAVLAAIAEAPGLSQAELGRAAGIDRSTLADMVARMEKRGWVDRTASLLDARAQSVHLSAAGAAKLAEAVGHARAADDAILDMLPRSKGKTFLAILNKLGKRDKAAKKDRSSRRKAKRDARRKKRDGPKAGKKRQPSRKRDS